MVKSQKPIRVGAQLHPQQGTCEEAATLVTMGFRELTLGFNGPAWEVDAGRDWLAWRDQQNR